jgi:hypothetical protein
MSGGEDNATHVCQGDREGRPYNTRKAASISGGDNNAANVCQGDREGRPYNTRKNEDVAATVQGTGDPRGRPGNPIALWYRLHDTFKSP